MAFLLANWKSILTFIVTLGIGYLIHSIDVDAINAKHEADIASTKAALEASCLKDKQLTEKVSNEYQTSIINLSNELAALKLRGSSCIVPIAKSSDGHHGSPAKSKHVKRNGITSGSLYDYAGKAETYRLRLVGCQSFIRQTWTAKGQ